MYPVIGQTAPDFLLHDTQKNAVRLSELKGQPVVLLFFPAAFTSVCTRELCRFRDSITQYNDINAKVFGISVDMPYSLKEYGKQQQLNFPLLSDFNKEAINAYGISFDNFSGWMNGVAKRAAFVIDANGLIQYSEVLEDAGLEPNYDAIDETLNKLNEPARS
jgi:peroxiredoxin